MAYNEAIRARNAEMDRARQWFKAKHDAPRVGADWASHCRAVAEWRKRSGFDRFMKRVGNLSFRKHGFVPVAEGGWRFDG